MLTVIHPTEFCVIDYRAWRALLWLHIIISKKEFVFASYPEYSEFLEKCQRYDKKSAYFSFLKTLTKIGEKRNLTPRQVETALWKYDQCKGIQQSS
jgi:hypothetical protein